MTSAALPDFVVASGPLADPALAPAAGDVLGLAIRATIVLGLALTLAQIIRRGPARTRHALWTATFAVLLILPAAAAWAPGWDIAVLPAVEGLDHGAAAPRAALPPGAAPIAAALRGSGPAATGVGQDAGGSGRAGPIRPVGNDAGFGAPEVRRGSASPARIVGVVWALGAGLGLISLLVGHARFRRLAATARDVNDPVWLGRIDRLRERLGIERTVRVVLHEDASTPMTGGIVDPVVVLPASADSWTPERRLVVLTHELVHVRRSDVLRQTLGRAALALYWFHPLGWIAARRASMSREQSCDEEVLGLGVRPSEYAAILVDLASGVRPARATLAISMIQPSDLEKRVMSILDPNRPRRNVVVSTGTLLIFGLVGIPAAIAQPVPRPPPLPPLAQASTELPPMPSVELPSMPSMELPSMPFLELPSMPSGELSPMPSIARPPMPPVEPATLPPASDRTAPPEPPAPQDPSCRMEGLRGSFSGNMSIDGDRRELSGTHDGDRVIQTYVDDLRLCMRIQGDVEMSDDGRDIRSIGSNGLVVLESEKGDLHRLVVTSGGSGLDYDWSVNGRSTDFGADAREWKERVLAVLAGRQEIASIRGEVAGLRGTIAGYRGEVASMRGEMARHRGEVAGIRGRIAAERGHIASMNGEIAGLRGRLSELNARMRNASDDETRRRLMTLSEEIERAIAEIRESEEVRSRHRHIAELEAEIEDYDLAAEIAAVEARLADYDLEARVAEIERQIDAVDADRRVAEIERRLEPEIDALRRLLERM